MRLLLDTHVLLALVEPRLGVLSPKARRALEQLDGEFHVSVASLWEIAIKGRIGKLALKVDPASLPELIREMGIEVIAISERHVLVTVAPESATRDPFDRLLLAQCSVEGLRLVTADRALAGHPLSAEIE